MTREIDTNAPNDEAAELEARFEMMARALQSDDSVVPQELFHYTNANGLLGILETGQLWATNVSYLNDSSEFEYGFRILKEAAGRFKAGNPESPISGLVDVFDVSIEQSDPPEVYVSCFCEEADLLGQWRGYGDSTGYCLGFRFGSRQPESITSPEHFSTVLGKVIYERDKQLARALQAFEMLSTAFTTAENEARH